MNPNANTGLYGQLTDIRGAELRAQTTPKTLQESLNELTALAERCKNNKLDAFQKKKSKNKKHRKIANASKKRNRR